MRGRAIVRRCEDDSQAMNPRSNSRQSRLSVLLIPLCFLVTLLVAACSKEDVAPPAPKLGNTSRIRLEWKGPFQLDKATYFVERGEIGRGLEGFREMLRLLDQADHSAHIELHFPEKWGSMQLDGLINPTWLFPFEGFSAEERAFAKKSGEKDFLFTFVGENDHDL